MLGRVGGRRMREVHRAGRDRGVADELAPERDGRREAVLERMARQRTGAGRRDDADAPDVSVEIELPVREVLREPLEAEEAEERFAMVALWRIA